MIAIDEKTTLIANLAFVKSKNDLKKNWGE